MMNLNKFNETKQQLLTNIVEAIKGGDEAKSKEAVGAFYQSIYEGIKADFDEYMQTQDDKALASRGYRQLTSEEKSFYQKLGEAVKASDAKQALLTNIPDGAMPTTIIEDVYKEIKQNHPLLSKITFRYVGYITKWILSDHTSQKGVWGKITDTITKEITSGLKEVDVKQNKLSAFVLIAKDLVDMGPTFLDAYIREVLTEAIALGLEDAIVNGNGVNCPVGMIRDIHKGVAFSTETGYPEKEAIKATSFNPKEYGELISPLAKTELGNDRTFDRVLMVVNMTGYLTKVMPATTALNADGTFTKDIFPFATDVVVSAVVPAGKAVVGIAKEYHLLAGGAQKGVIEHSDEYKFLDDVRTYKIKQHAAGQAYDDTCFILVDISELEERYITVLNKDLIEA